MAESNHDDLADALARMAEGDVAPSEHEPAQPAVPIPTPVKNARPAPPRQVTARPAAPVSPVPPKPRTATPAKTIRPAAPGLSSSAPQSPTAPPAQVRRQRPSAPTLGQPTMVPSDAEVDGGQSTGLSQEATGENAVDDDDAVIVPAPEASVFMPRKSLTSASARAAVQKRKNLEYRRTLIPVLLTSGALLCVFGVLKFFAGPDSMLQSLPGWIPVGLLCAGVVLLILAVINMISVKHQLASGKN